LVNHDLTSEGGSAVRGTSTGEDSTEVRMVEGSCSGDMLIVVRLTEILSTRRTPHRPIDFQIFRKNPSLSGPRFTPMIDPASTPILPSTLTQIPPSDVRFRTSTRSGPRMTSASFKRSSGDELRAYEAYEYNTANTTATHTDRDTKNTNVSLERNLRRARTGVGGSSGGTKDGDAPVRSGVRSVASCTLRLPLSIGSGCSSGFVTEFMLWNIS